MTKILAGNDLATQINSEYSGSIVSSNETTVWVDPAHIFQVCDFLRTDPVLDFQFLTSISAVDYIEYFELIYQLLSMRNNHSLVVKSRIYDRERPSVQSVVEIWRGADLQEREIWDLMGVIFEGHPNMKRVLLWEGFKGHPLRKDFLG